MIRAREVTVNDKYYRIFEDAGCFCGKFVRRDVPASADHTARAAVYAYINLLPSACTNCYSYCLSNYINHILDRR